MNGSGGDRVRDVLAGLSVAGLMLPEGVAYAGIAGLAPGRALAAGIAGGLAYALIGRSRFAVAAPTSSSAAILAAALGSLGVAGAARDMMATAMILIVAAIFLGLAAARLGGLAGFISRPVLRGFALGLALTIIAKQLPKLVGVHVAAGPIWHVLGGVLGQAGHWNLPSLSLGCAALALLLLLRRVPRLPEALLVIGLGVGLSYLVDLPRIGVALAGPVTMSAPHLALPADFATWARLVQLAAPIALILFAESWGTIRNLALAHGDPVSPNRELAAIGTANLAAGLALGMPVGAGFSGGSANATAGATSRVAAACASLALLGLALFAGPQIARIPEPVLAAVVIGALTHALSPAPIVRLFRIDRDQWIAVAAAAGVLALGVLNGMLAAIGLSILQLLYRLSHPSISELGRTGDDGHDFVDIAHHPEARPVPGLAIFRPNAPLIFANAESTLRAISETVLARPARTLVLSLEETSDLDSTAAEALGETARALAANGRAVILARLHDHARAVLAAIGQTALAGAATYSVADAADAALAPPPAPVSPAKE